MILADSSFSTAKLASVDLPEPPNPDIATNTGLVPSGSICWIRQTSSSLEILLCDIGYTLTYFPRMCRKTCRHPKAQINQVNVDNASKINAIVIKNPSARLGIIHFWRRGRDSNPRYRFRHDGFQDRYLQPLGHLSVSNHIIADYYSLQQMSCNHGCINMFCTTFT